MRARRKTGRSRSGRDRRPGVEALETRRAPAIDFVTALGLGATGSPADLRANAVAEDGAGHLIVVGSIQGTADFDPGPGTVARSGAGNRDAFVAEYTAAGALVWVQTFRGTAGSSVVEASSVAVDATGIYVAGSFSGEVDFDPGAGSRLLSAPSRTDAFAAKLDAGGGLIWASATVGSTFDQGQTNGIAPDGTGGAVIAGSFDGTARFGSTTLTATGLSEAFAARLDASGSFAWARATSGSGPSSASAGGVAVDGAGRVVLGGFVAGSADFDPGAGVTTLSAVGSRDIAVWVFDASGSLAWAQSIGGAELDQAEAVAVDPSGNVYATGAYSGSVDFRATQPRVTLTATGIYDAFAVKLSPTGTLTWARGFDGSDNASRGEGIAVDPTGRVVVGGWFGGSVDFDPGPGSARLASAGSTDAFVALLDSGGTYVDAKRAGGAGSDLALGLAFDASGTVAIAGTYTGPATFGATTLPAIGARSIFASTLTTSTPPSAPTAPTAPTLDPASDSGSSNSDRLTSVRSPFFSVVSTDAGYTVRLLRDGLVVASRLGTGPVIDTGPVPDGAHVYTALQVDARGLAGPASPGLIVTIDSTAPAAPGAPRLLAADDSGTVGDGVTNVVRPRHSGTVEAGADVRLVDSAGRTLGTVTSGVDGAYTLSPASPLPEGANRLAVVAVDAAGNASAVGTAVVLVVDLTPPTAPTLWLVPADDSGILGDRLTRVVRPRLTGTAEPGASVTLIDVAGRTLGRGTSGASGTYTITPDAPLVDGPVTIRATATDPAGNVGLASPTLTLTIDTTPPAPPSIGLLAADDTGVKGDGFTVVRRPRLTGTGERGMLVEVVDGSGAVVATATASAFDGAFTLVLPARGAGTVAYSARGTDPAGNVGPAGAPLAVTIPATAGDFDGDGVADLATYRPATAAWTVRSSASGLSTVTPFGQAKVDLPMPADFDGDGKADIAVYRPTTAEWFVRRSSDGVVSVTPFGWAGVDIPIPADFDGDGRADFAVYRPTTGEWFVRGSRSNGVTVTPFGLADVDTPVAADYDGDGRADQAVYRSSAGAWFVRRSTDGTASMTSFGMAGVDRPVPADFDGDGRADLATYRPTTGTWFVLPAGGGGVTSTPFGQASIDLAVPGDYDGDGKADIAVYRPTTSQFFFKFSGGAPASFASLGESGDRPALLPTTYLLTSKFRLASASRPVGQVVQVPIASATRSAFVRSALRATSIPSTLVADVLRGTPDR